MTKNRTKTEAAHAPETERTEAQSVPVADDHCTFAIRLPRVERDALHAVAGPGGATKFVRSLIQQAIA